MRFNLTCTWQNLYRIINYFARIKTKQKYFSLNKLILRKLFYCLPTNNKIIIIQINLTLINNLSQI